MRQSGFHLNNGMKYMNIYRDYLNKQKKCANDLQMWKLSHPVMQSAHKTIVKKIESNNLNNMDVFKRVDFNRQVNLPELNSNVFRSDDSIYAKQVNHAKVAKSSSERSNEDMMAMFNNMMSKQDSSSMSYLNEHTNQQNNQASMVENQQDFMNVKQERLNM